MKRITIAAAAVMLASASAVQAAPTITNGDFEASAPGSLPASWVVTPGNEIITIAGFQYGPCCGAFGTPAQLANQFASFGPGNFANISTLQQTFGTVIGRTYTVSFDYGVLGSGPQTIFASIFGAGPTAIAGLSATRSANANLGTTFGNYGFTFVADSTSTTISFNVDRTTDSVDGILDNVAVGAVPEPASWALLILGFGVLGSALRRRGGKQVALTA